MDKILIIGAAGKIGSELIKLFDCQKPWVKLLLRTKSKELSDKYETVIGDLSNKESLRNAMLDVKTVFLLSSPSPEQVYLQKNLIDVAKELNINHIVRVSAMGIEYDSNNPFTITSIALWHNEIDKYLEASKIKFTLIKPNYFMQNLGGFTNSIQQESCFYATITPRAKVSLVHITDIARLAHHVLINTDDHINKSYDITGPEALSFSDIAKYISIDLNKIVNYVQVSEQELKIQLSKDNIPEWFIKDMLGFFKGYSAGCGEKINSIQQVANLKPTYFNSMQGFFK